MSKENKNKKNYKGIECLNCGQPLNSKDLFCSNCGQKNDVRKLQLSQLLSEFLSSFYSLDSKFLRTIIPLITKPGKVTADYFEGKRTSYMNPFRFYINVSILFFLLQGIVGFFESVKEVKEQPFSISPTNTSFIKDTVKKKKIDSIMVAENVDIKELDSARKKFNWNVSDDYPFFKKIEKFQKFYRAHRDVSVKNALDSLNYPATFNNQFVYKKSKDLVRLIEDTKYRNEIGSEIYSNISVALFLMLPIFALFFKIAYFRRSFTYLEHLVFIFHTQSVFFLMMIFFFLFDKLFKTEFGLFIMIFLFGYYLYKAMRFYYQQNTFKTILKYGFLITSFFIISFINLLFVSLFSFATN